MARAVWYYRDKNIPGYSDHRVVMEFSTLTGDGINVITSPGGCYIPDDEIPALVAALQNYMSQRAREQAQKA